MHARSVRKDLIEPRRLCLRRGPTRVRRRHSRTNVEAGRCFTSEGLERRAAVMKNERRESANSLPEVDERPYLDAAREARSRYGRFNLAVVGGTGVGKSSLINAVFGRDLAKVGKGLPVTRGAQYFHDESLGIWDLEGFEIGSATSPGEVNPPGVFGERIAGVSPLVRG
ncbi:MAG: GTPase, partial [Microcella pacifica]